MIGCFLLVYKPVDGGIRVNEFNWYMKFTRGQSCWRSSTETCVSHLLAGWVGWKSRKARRSSRFSGRIRGTWVRQVVIWCCTTIIPVVQSIADKYPVRDDECWGIQLVAIKGTETSPFTEKLKWQKTARRITFVDTHVWNKQPFLTKLSVGIRTAHSGAQLDSSKWFATGVTDKRLTKLLVMCWRSEGRPYLTDA